MDEKSKEKIKIINLTPHDIHVMDENKNILHTFRSEGIARVKEKTNKLEDIIGIPVYSVDYGEVENLPTSGHMAEQIEQDLMYACAQPRVPIKKYYIVSNLTALSIKETRYDILIVGEAVRDEQGRIIGCKNFYKLTNHA